MKLHYQAEPDSLYIEFKPAPAPRRARSPTANADFATDGTIVGFDIDRASQRLDMSTSDTGALPLKAA